MSNDGNKHLTPAEAIRAKCRVCVGGELGKITHCTARTPVKPCDPSGCFLWPYRSGSGCDRSREAKPPSRLRAIVAECRSCMGGNRAFVKDCESHHCPLWLFRRGRNPHRAGIGGVSSHSKAVEARSDAATDL